jgi:hypothetical protein
MRRRTDSERDQPPKAAAHVRALVHSLIFLLGSAGGGCVSVDAIKAHIAYNDSTNDFVMGWRNTAWAHKAWHARKEQFVGEPQLHAFGIGFRDGYVAVASGGNGCPPPLPPRWFWNWRYQTGEGQAQVAAWFAGYPHGARAADEEGAGLYQQIQVSHPIEVQYSPEFQQAITAQEMLREMGPAFGAPTGPMVEPIYPAPGPPPYPRYEAPILPPPGGAFVPRPEANWITGQTATMRLPQVDEAREHGIAPASYDPRTGADLRRAWEVAPLEPRR